jgi:hypothetical protein
MFAAGQVAALYLVAVALPTPVPPETAGLAPGYHLNPHGCIVSANEPRPISFSLNPRPVDNSVGEPPEFSKKYPGVHDTYLAELANWNGDFNRAVILWKKVMNESKNEASWTMDAEYRLPLSISLYQAGRKREARAQWQLLARDGRYTSDDGTRLAIAGDFRASLRAFAVSPPGFNPITFRESGAAFNLQRGLNAAAIGQLRDARQYLGYALECMPFFQVPHLILGVIAMSSHDVVTARKEWLLALEGWDPAPPDIAGVTGAQLDALALLTRYG